MFIGFFGSFVGSFVRSFGRSCVLWCRATLRRLTRAQVPATMRGLLWHYRLPCEGCLIARLQGSRFILCRATLRRLPTTRVPATMRGLLWHNRLPCEGCLTVHGFCTRYVSGYSAEAASGTRASYHAWAAWALQATLRGLPCSLFRRSAFAWRLDTLRRLPGLLS